MTESEIRKVFESLLTLELRVVDESGRYSPSIENMWIGFYAGFTHGRCSILEPMGS